MLVKSNTDVWNPTLKIISNTYESIKKQEEEQFLMEYKTKLDEAMRDKRTY